MSAQPNGPVKAAPERVATVKAAHAPKHSLTPAARSILQRKCACGS
ncbi:MAG: hypothetical protein QOF02_3339, partial [Blastocatellia bacterium]|nr:hypothetical protein [Blastocatellia bacterium]